MNPSLLIMSYILKAVLILCFSLFLSSCVKDDDFELLPEDDISEQDYLLYSLALDQIGQFRYIPNDLFVIQQSTNMYTYSRGEYDRVNHRLCNWYQKFNEDFFENYSPLQKEAINLGNRFKIASDYYLISRFRPPDLSIEDQQVMNTRQQIKMSHFSV